MYASIESVGFVQHALHQTNNEVTPNNPLRRLNEPTPACIAVINKAALKILSLTGKVTKSTTTTPMKYTITA